MDPNELLKKILEQANEMVEESELAQDILNLNEWITKGGFLPSVWDSVSSKKKGQKNMTENLDNDKLYITAYCWYDTVNGNPYSRIEAHYKGSSHHLACDYRSHTDDQILADVLQEIGSDIGFVRNENGHYPQSTIFCRENGIQYDIKMLMVSKRECFKKKVS